VVVGGGRVVVVVVVVDIVLVCMSWSVVMQQAVHYRLTDDHNISAV